MKGPHLDTAPDEIGAGTSGRAVPDDEPHCVDVFLSCSSAICDCVNLIGAHQDGLIGTHLGRGSCKGLGNLVWPGVVNSQAPILAIPAMFPRCSARPTS